MFTDEVKLTRGTCWLMVALILILQFVFLFIGIAWTSRVKQTEINAIEIQETREDVKSVSDKLDEIQKTLSDQAVKDAEIKGRDFGYSVGRADKKAGH